MSPRRTNIITLLLLLAFSGGALGLFLTRPSNFLLAADRLNRDDRGPLRSLPALPQEKSGRKNKAQNEKSKTVPPVRFDPVSRNIEGWKVHVDPALLKGNARSEEKRTLQMLANHLQRIKILVPTKPLKKLQTVEIWIEKEHPILKAMQYHPSKRWLTDHGHDPRLAKKVHITRAHQLLSRQQLLKHPAVILHELAHGFHDQILGFDDPRIEDAYESAKKQGIYEQVLLYTGRTVRHYGLSNAKEYFAEGTEAYFYRNDFYPFVRAELKRHDPQFHDVLQEIWGPAK